MGQECNIRQEREREREKVPKSQTWFFYVATEKVLGGE